MRCSLLFAIFFLASGTDVQSNCPPLVAPAPDPARLLFTPGQESELGEIIREQLEGSFRVIEDDQVTAYLKRIGGRVAQHLPDTGLHYDFLLYDQPEVQAFSMPGGRVFIAEERHHFSRNVDASSRKSKLSACREDASTFLEKWCLSSAMKTNWPVCWVTNWDILPQGNRRWKCRAIFGRCWDSKLCPMTMIFLASTINLSRACA